MFVNDETNPGKKYRKPSASWSSHAWINARADVQRDGKAQAVYPRTRMGRKSKRKVFFFPRRHVEREPGKKKVPSLQALRGDGQTVWG